MYTVVHYRNCMVIYYTAIQNCHRYYFRKTDQKQLLWGSDIWADFNKGRAWATQVTWKQRSSKRKKMCFTCMRNEESMWLEKRRQKGGRSFWAQRRTEGKGTYRLKNYEEVLSDFIWSAKKSESSFTAYYLTFNKMLPRSSVRDHKKKHTQPSGATCHWCRWNC